MPQKSFRPLIQATLPNYKYRPTQFFEFGLIGGVTRQISVQFAVPEFLASGGTPLAPFGKYARAKSSHAPGQRFDNAATPNPARPEDPWRLGGNETRRAKPVDERAAPPSSLCFLRGTLSWSAPLSSGSPPFSRRGPRPKRGLRFGTAFWLWT